MENIIIIAILAILIIIGILSTRKHFRGEGGCCGGKSSPSPRLEKKLNHVIGQKIVRIDGMTCEHCVNWVERSINEIDGAAARVNLKKREAVVSLEKDIPDEVIIAAVKNAGYRVLEIL